MGSLISDHDCTATNLMALLGQRKPFVAETARGFRRLQRLVESMALTSDEFSFAHNWLTSAEQLWEVGDRHAARYQVDQVAKKLLL